MARVEENYSTELEFSSKNLIPKIQTQQEQFLKQHPEYDGRDIIIAVLDTGVDPALPGLQTTTTGERKMIDCVDCSGAGDVDTSVVKNVTDGVVEGLTGRKLKIPESWQNPSGKYHLGVKPIYELYPTGLRKIIKEERKKEGWDPVHSKAVADTLRKLRTHEEKVGKCSEKVADKLDREDLASQIDFLNGMEKSDEHGPVADCLVWHEGKQWMACIDTTFNGELEQCRPMGVFKQTGEFGQLSEKDQTTYTFRIDSDGNWLEICVANASHGSHVANIIAANFPDAPEKNGLAPGAKIVSFCIGDSRLNSMETGTGLTRAFNLCAEYGVNMINLSYGEGSHFPNKGRIIEELQALVNKYNIVCVCAAGNNGPALTTVDAPGGTTSGVLGIGAYITPDMADPLYGVFNSIDGNLYPWSSRGPCSDGWLGVSLCAPGAALTGVPKYTRQGGQMMNGTSMSSPNAAGAIACLLSALKANGQDWSPYQIRVALENTAQSNEKLDKFSEGQGMVQIENGFEFLLAHGSFFPKTMTDITIEVSQGPCVRRGVYLRELVECSHKQEFQVSVTPRFQEFSDPTHSIDFERYIVLKTTEDWVTTPDKFVCMAKGRSFFMEVDPTQIQPGTAAFTEVLGFDSENPKLGPIFRVPITVVRPEQVKPDQELFHQFNFDAPSGTPVRRFISTPEHATMIEIKVTSLSRNHQDRFILHKVHLEEELSFRDSQNMKNLGPDTLEWKHVFPVKSGRTVELCLTRAWSRGSKKPAKVQMDVRFHGVVRDSNFQLVHGAGSTLVHATIAPFRPVEIAPAVTLDTLLVPLKVATSAIEPLGPQDKTLSGEKVFRMILSYKLTLTEKAEVRFELPGLSEFLYESPIDCVCIQIFTCKKEFIAAGSTYPDRYSHKLEKGEYTIFVQIRRPQVSTLEGLKDTPLHAFVKLPTALSLDVYRTPYGAVTRDSNAKKWSICTLDAGQQFALYLGSIPNEKVPTVCTVYGGCQLIGNLTVIKDEDIKAVDKTAVVYNFTEYSTRTPAAPSMITLKEKEKKKEPKVEMEEAVRDLQISWLKKLTDDVENDRIYSELIQKYPSHLPLLQAKLKQLMNKKVLTEEDAVMIDRIVDAILNICQPKEVLQYFGCKQEYNEHQVNIKKVMDEKKTAIVDGLIGRGTVLINSHLKGSTLNIPTIFKKTGGCIGERKISLEEVDLAYSEVLKWVSTSTDDSKILLLSAKHAIAHDHKGKALKYLQKSVDEGKGTTKSTVWADQAIAELCDSLGWFHISNRVKNAAIIENMKEFRPFQCF